MFWNRSFRFRMNRPTSVRHLRLSPRENPENETNLFAPVMHSRKYLPSMGLLVAFEACARLQKFTAAAQELNLTQSAVSRQIRGLEEAVGVDLFHRERQTVRLTPAGELYAQEIRAALDAVASATLRLRASPGAGTLTLAILPTMGTRWLAPRLPRFAQDHPGITLNLVTRLEPFDLDAEGVHAALHYGDPVWPRAELDVLFEETVNDLFQNID